MPYDIPTLLLPLVGGYLILVHSLFFKYRYERISSQKLIFESIIAGILLFFTTYLIRLGTYYLFPKLFQFFWNIIQFFPYHRVLLGTAIFSFLFSTSFVYLTNRLLRKRLLSKRRFKIFVKAIKEHGDELEALFLEAFILRKLVQVTLKNNKIYIGFIERVNEPQKTNYTEIIPFWSGYREPTTKIARYNYFFESVLNSIKKNEDLKIIIKQDEILTASFFDPEIYDELQKQTTDSKK